MRNALKHLLVASALASLALVTGCGKGDNPTVPAAPAPEYVDVTVKLVRLLAVADGDGIEGAGEFTFKAVVSDGQPGTLVASGGIGLDTGSTYDLNKTRVIRITKGEAHPITVDFTGTEWDQSIFGVTYADTRMDNLNEFRTHTEASGSSGFNDGERWITLGTGDLQLRLVYTITSVPVP